MLNILEMEVDSPMHWKESLESISCDSTKFSNLKSFVNAAREFEATHSEASVNLMNRYLGLITSSCDLSVFSPGRSEVCAFFSSLWRVMCDTRAPIWAAVAVLARAAAEPNVRYALTHTYKFMPILARLLSDSLSNEEKIKLLSVMQDISYGIKISWLESYLSELMKRLTDMIVQPMTEAQQRVIGDKALTVLVNVCYGNLPVVHTLMRTVDTKEFVVHLMNLKDGGYGGVEVCRLLVCLSGATNGASATPAADVHDYLACTMNSFCKAVWKQNATQMLHAYTFMSDLCCDSNLRTFVLAYPNFSAPLEEAFRGVANVCQAASNGSKDADNATRCLCHAIKFLTLVVKLDLYSLRCHHGDMVNICVLGSQICLPEALELFAAILSQYKDEGRLPEHLKMEDNLSMLLKPPVLEPGKTGLQWLQVVGALCDMTETQDRVLRDVTTECFEDTLYSVLHYMSQNGAAGAEQAQLAVTLGCRVCLTLAPVARTWHSALARMLAHHQVRKLLCAGLCGTNASRRRQVLQLIKHHYFPSDLMHQVFGETNNASQETRFSSFTENSDCSTDAASVYHAGQNAAPAHEQAIDRLVTKLNEALQGDKISDITTSSLMELYGYKITCLEQKLHSHTLALQEASRNIASLQHILAMSEATGSAQQDLLYTTQMQKEKQKRTIDELHKQLQDAELTLKHFRAKLVTEKLDRENQLGAARREARAQIAAMENEMKARQKETEDRLKRAEEEAREVQNKLEQQTNKNSELAGVLVKFEERVKHRDRRLEEAAAADAAQRRDIELRDATIKQLEKTVLERENRLHQVTTQLEEMKRVQEMVAKLMSKSTSSINPS